MTDVIISPLFDKLLDINNLYDSYLKCIQNVDWKTSVQKYSANLWPNLLKLKEELLTGTYKQKPFVEFDINERGKMRHIKALHISDRVLQRCLCDYVLMPELERYLAYDNGASIKGKGISFARKRIVTHLEKFYREYHGEGYVLQIDFKKFFENINHKSLIRLFSYYIKDNAILNLLQYLIGVFSDDGVGVGIGSQLSQVAGILLPTVVDNYIKTVSQMRYSARYMDDTYVFALEKKSLESLLEGIKEICNHWGIVINTKKTQIHKISRGFVFLKIKYSYEPTGHIVKRPCRGTFVRERRKMKKLLSHPNVDYNMVIEQYKSWRYNLRHYDCHKQIYDMDRLMASYICKGDMKQWKQMIRKKSA